jgi:PAS domain S-box-containing protein
MAFTIRKIQNKILLAFFLMIVLAGVISSVTFLYQKNINYYHAYKDYLNELRHLTAQVDGIQKDFISIDSKDEIYMTSGRSKHISQFNANVQETNQLLTTLKNHPTTEEFKLGNTIDKISKLRNEYNRNFEVLQRKMRERGFKSYGLEGRMRDYIHFIEEIDVDNELVLQIRRHEKDFFLRKDIEYKAKLHQTAEKLKRKIVDSKIIDEQKEKFITYLNDYEKLFDNIVRIEQEIGLDTQKGIRGKMKTTHETINQEVQTIYELISFYIDSLIFQAQLIVISAILIMLVTGVIFAIYFSYSISRPITLLDRVAKSVVKGLRGQETFLDRINTDDEVGDLSKNFKIMLEKLKSSIQDAEDRNKQLEEFVKEEYKRNWENEGLALFGDILRNNSEDLEKQSLEIITTLVKYTGSVQGGLFIVNDEDENHQYLELKACYAYERRKFLQKRIDFGEGLLGEIWREGDTKLITDIPQDYLNVTSGLGRTNPTCLLIVPIKTDDKIEGIIEIASFNIYEQYKIDFIERLSRRIATNLAAVKSNEKNIKLLYAAKDFSKQIEAKEAELQRRVKEYDTWVQQFEQKLNSVSEESHIYQYVLNKIYDGIVITDEKFTIVKVNNYILRKFRYKRSELEGQSVDILVETDYNNIIDLKEKKFQLSYRAFSKKVTGKIIDHFGNQHFVQMMSGKMEIDTKIIYVFLFNELTSEELSQLNQMNDNNSGLLPNS